MIWVALIRLVKSIGPRAWLALAVCAALGLAAWRIDHRAYARGYAASEASQRAITEALQAQIDRAAGDLRTASDQIEAYEEASRMLARGIEDEFSADPGAVDRVPTDADRLRLKRWWGAGQN